MDNTNNLMHDPSVGRRPGAGRILMWATAGLAALAVLATVVLMGREPTGQDHSGASAALRTPAADQAAGEPSSPGFGLGSLATGDEGFGAEQGGVDEAAEEDLTWEEKLESLDPDVPAAGANPLEGWDPPSDDDAGFHIEIPDSWSVGQDQVTGSLAYRSDGGPDPLMLYVTPAGPAVGNQLEGFAELMRSGLVDQGAVVGEAEAVQVGGRPALYMSMAKPGHDRPGALWLLDAGGDLYTIVAELPADPGARADLSDELEAAVQSFDVPGA
jgi:hypothetical protein